MIILGITGGSGSGKTSVSDIFRKLGVYVIDADVVAREIVGKGMMALEEIVDYFGVDILNADGTLDRKKLANIVFSDNEKLMKLNEITHKYITQNIEQTIKKQTGEIVGIDGAVLIESGIDKKCDYICTVLADEKIRVDRIVNRDNLTFDEAKNRISSQKSDSFYIAKSDFIIYNNTDIINLKGQIQRIIDTLKAN